MTEDLRSKSQMKRIAALNPEMLVEECARLREALNQAKALYCYRQKMVDGAGWEVEQDELDKWAGYEEP